MVRAVCCEQKIQPRITRICTNGDVMQKFFGLPKKIFVSIRVIGYAELKVRGKKNSVPSPARNHSGVDIVRSRIAVSATLPVPYRVLRLAFAMTRRVDCWFFVSLTNSRNVICPLALRSLKTLRALNLGKNKRAVFYDNHDNLGQLFSEPREEPYLLLIVVYCCPCCRFIFFSRALRGTLLLSLVV